MCKNSLPSFLFKAMGEASACHKCDGICKTNSSGHDICSCWVTQHGKGCFQRGKTLIYESLNGELKELDNISFFV